MTTSSQAAIGSEDTRTRYYANRGKVYAEGDPDEEVGSARSANGAELERFDRALDRAREQRAELDRIAKLAEPMRGELVDAPRSHWLAIEPANHGRPFTKEEVHPRVRVHFVPRVGTVLVELSADKYVASFHDRETGGSESRFTDWRIVPRSYREDRPDDEAHRAPEISGLGPKTAPAVAKVAEEIVRSWLESDDYQRSRERAAAAAIVREIRDAGGRGYNFDRARRYLEEAVPDLDSRTCSIIKTQLERIAGAFDALDEL